MEKKQLTWGQIFSSRLTQRLKAALNMNLDNKMEKYGQKDLRILKNDADRLDMLSDEFEKVNIAPPPEMKCFLVKGILPECFFF